jgi:hypothetical protein
VASACEHAFAPVQNGIGGRGRVGAGSGGSGRTSRAIASQERLTTVSDLFMDGVHELAVASWVGGGQSGGEATTGVAAGGGFSEEEGADGSMQDETEGEREGDGQPVTFALHAQFGGDDFASLLRVEVLAPPPLLRLMEWCRVSAPPTFRKSEALDAAGHGVSVEAVAAALAVLEHNGWCSAVQRLPRRGEAQAVIKDRAGPKRSRGAGGTLPPPKRNRQVKAGGQLMAAGHANNVARTT